MITYELAKRLRDAGFPLKNGGLITEAVYPPDCVKHMQEEISNIFDEHCIDLAIWPPTIEELIEACGTEIDTIKAPSERLPDGEHVHWVVYQKGNKEEMFVSVYLDEALALFWLALNEKKV